MNQHLIDQLLHKAGARFGAEGIDYSSFTSSKFAELIVRECLELTLGQDRKQLLDKGDTNGANLIQKDIVRVIKHFGVEE